MIYMAGPMASWLVNQNQHQMSIHCVFSAINFTFTVPLSTQEHTVNGCKQTVKEPAKMLGGR